MHLWIVVAAFALAAVTPYLSAPSRSDADFIQIADNEEAAGETNEETDQT